jgi:release factor glutamine methyltransferase
VNAGEALRRGAGGLRMAGIEDPEIEAEVLLRHALGLSRAHLFLRLQDPLTDDDERRYRALLARRTAHVPTAYITGCREFYGLELAVGPGVLIPRPETEHVVEECLRVGKEMLTRRSRVTLVDVGTGSGAIALAVARHLPALRVLATDCSPAALAQADLNAKRLRLAGRVTFLAGDLLEGVHEPVDIIAANLPYIPTQVIPTLAPEVREHEPRAALDGGDDGLRVIVRLLGQAPRHLRDGGGIILEIGHDQAEPLRYLVGEVLPGACVTFARDLAGIERVATIQV